MDIEEDTYEDRMARQLQRTSPTNKRARALKQQRSLSEIMKEGQVFGEDGV